MSLLRIRICMRAIKLTRFVRTKSPNYTLLQTQARRFIKSAAFYYPHISPPYLVVGHFMREKEELLILQSVNPTHALYKTYNSYQGILDFFEATIFQASLDLCIALSNSFITKKI
ncbi:hypothetical protein ALC57_07278 [Trachymyrmex cornetzi]|uniref:Uncharacterized protein n=1 Tax=Trachymyrmex cornetzi TaxID=471704 RepID=A0A195E5D8_9HYME|nr:hypothetical protein ALC57_07278 [Trachymyrmex cornetzi]